MGKMGLEAGPQNSCNFGTGDLKSVTGTCEESCKAAGGRGRRGCCTYVKPTCLDEGLDPITYFVCNAADLGPTFLPCLLGRKVFRKEFFAFQNCYFCYTSALSLVLQNRVFNP